MKKTIGILIFVMLFALYCWFLIEAFGFWAFLGGIGVIVVIIGLILLATYLVSDD